MPLAPAQTPKHKVLGALGGQAQGIRPPPLGPSASKVWEVGQGYLVLLCPLSSHHPDWSGVVKLDRGSLRVCDALCAREDIALVRPPGYGLLTLA